MQVAQTASGPDPAKDRGLFTSLTWTPTRICVAILLTVGLAYLCYGSVLKFIRIYPGAYVWSELLISYEGGLVRRGLLGEIAFLLHPFVPAHRLFAALFTGLYFVTFGVLVWIACGRFRTSSLMLLASPAALLFPFGDMNAFGRKEALFLAAFLIAVTVLSRMRSPAMALAITMVIFAPLILMHEAAGLSFAIAVIFLFHTGARERSWGWMVRASIAVVAYVAVMIGLIVALRGSPEQIDRMIAAWRAIVPGAFDPPFAGGGHLADTLTDPFRFTAMHVMAPLTFGSYLIAFVLAVIPLVWWFRERRLQPHPLFGYWGWLAVLVPSAALFAYVGDWGRCIHIVVMQVGIMQLVAGDTLAEERVAPDPGHDLRRLLVWLVPLAYFGFSWTVLHWVQNGDSGLAPGALFRMLGTTK